MGKLDFGQGQYPMWSTVIIDNKIFMPRTISKLAAKKTENFHFLKIIQEEVWGNFVVKIS